MKRAAAITVGILGGLVYGLLVLIASIAVGFVCGMAS